MRRKITFGERDIKGKFMWILRSIATMNTQMIEVYELPGSPGFKGKNAGKGGIGGKGGSAGRAFIKKAASNTQFLNFHLTSIEGLDGIHGSSGEPGIGGKHGQDYDREYISEKILQGLRVNSRGFNNKESQGEREEEKDDLNKEKFENMGKEFTEQTARQVIGEGGFKYFTQEATKTLSKKAAKRAAQNAATQGFATSLKTAGQIGVDAAKGLGITAALSFVSSGIFSRWKTDPQLSENQTITFAENGIIPVDKNVLGSIKYEKRQIPRISFAEYELYQEQERNQNKLLINFKFEENIQEIIDKFN